MTMFFTVVITMTLLWLLPFILISQSKKVSGKEKLAWFIAIFFVSWLAWVLYLFLAPIKKTEPKLGV